MKPTLFYEDMQPGQKVAGASIVVDKAEMLAFAAIWDPLAIHVDEEAGHASFGSLTAPGIYLLALIALCLALAGTARAEDWSVWQRAYDPATRTRFIPVELWTGALWDGTQEIRMMPAALEFGRRGDKSIKGPTTWNGIQVYERLNRDKLQLFAIRDDRTGLGRVFDSRYPQLGCRGEVKFPLGHWKQGEVREYQLDCARGKRPLRVTIEEIDFVYDGVPHSLRFHWLFMEGRGRGTDMRYVYSPLRGLVDVQGNE